VIQFCSEAELVGERCGSFQREYLFFCDDYGGILFGGTDGEVYEDWGIGKSSNPLLIPQTSLYLRLSDYLDLERRSGNHA
jgi:hypothetical protein